MLSSGKNALLRMPLLNKIQVGAGRKYFSFQSSKEEKMEKEP